MLPQRTSALVQPLRRLLRRGARAHASNMLSKLHPADVARLLAHLDDDEQSEVFALVVQDSAESAGEVLSEMEPPDAVAILSGREETEVAEILGGLGADDAAELVAALPEDVASGVLAKLEQADRGHVEDLLAYEEDTAGRIMTPEVFALQADVTVAHAIEILRSSRSEDLEMVFYLYVVNATSNLVGVCSLRDLLLRSPSSILGDVMDRRIVSVDVDTDQEEVARIVARYNYLAVPVVDHDKRLVGIITVDDVIDIIREEESEDMLLMAGVGEDEQEVLTAPLRRNVVLRLPWLFAAWMGGLAASVVIDQYSEMLAEMVVLTGFLPIILGMGGNVGTQAATIVVRGLATGKLVAGHHAFTVLRELRVALSLGIVFGVLLGVTVQLRHPEQPALGLAIGLSLVSCMALAATVGASMPIVLNRFGIDPAIATGPFVTTSIDVLGIVAYLGIATLLVVR